jgi:hypothetical protein
MAEGFADPKCRSFSIVGEPTGLREFHSNKFAISILAVRLNAIRSKGGKLSMKSSNVQPTAVSAPSDAKSYSAPGLARLTPDAAREMLLKHGERNDPEVKFMLDCIERLRDPQGS